MDGRDRRSVRTAALVVASALYALALAGCDLLPAAGARVAAPAAELGTVPLQVVRAGGSVVVLVAVSVQGQGPYDFVLDTGASRSVVDR